jgi:hypothetical protein
MAYCQSHKRGKYTQMQLTPVLGSLRLFAQYFSLLSLDLFLKLNCSAAASKHPLPPPLFPQQWKTYFPFLKIKLLSIFSPRPVEFIRAEASSGPLWSLSILPSLYHTLSRFLLFLSFFFLSSRLSFGLSVLFLTHFPFFFFMVSFFHISLCLLFLYIFSLFYLFFFSIFSFYRSFFLSLTFWLTNSPSLSVFHILSPFSSFSIYIFLSFSNHFFLFHLLGISHLFFSSVIFSLFLLLSVTLNIFFRSFFLSTKLQEVKLTVAFYM